MTLDKYLAALAKQPTHPSGVELTSVSMVVACWEGAANTRLAGSFFTQARITDADGNLRSFDWQEDVSLFVETP